MGYAKTSHAVPGFSLSKIFYGPDTEYSSWVGFGPLAVPETTPWFIFNVGFIYSMEWDKHAVGITATIAIEFADDDSVVHYTVAGPYVNDATSFRGATMIPVFKPATFAGTLTQCRAALAFSGYPMSGVSTQASVTGGSLELWYTTTVGELVEVEATLDAGASLPLHHVITAGAVGREISKLRYRLTQSAAGAGDWSGTPIGEPILRKYR